MTVVGVGGLDGGWMGWREGWINGRTGRWIDGWIYRYSLKLFKNNKMLD